MAATATTFNPTKFLSSTPKPLYPLFSSQALSSSFSSFSSISHRPLKLHHFHRHPKPINFSAAPKISATITVGDKLPDATLSYLDSSNAVHTVSISDLTANKKAILFAIAGAFTPTGPPKHSPPSPVFAETASKFKAKGVDIIACISVNDAFVMKAWKKTWKMNDEVLLLSDGNGVFTKAVGCELDLSDKRVGPRVRSTNYAMYVDDGVVKVLQRFYC